MRNSTTKLLLKAVATLAAGGSMGAQSCCNPCEVNEFLETVGYEAVGAPTEIAFQPHKAYCEVDRSGVRQWVEVPTSRLSYRFRPAYLGEPTVDDQGHASYPVEIQTLADRTASTFDVWMACGDNEKDRTPGNEDPMLQFLDLDAARDEHDGSYTIPVIRVTASGNTGQILEPYGARGSRALPFAHKRYSLCVIAGALPVTMKLQSYAPVLECRNAEPPSPTPPPPPISCARPGPDPITTCSGASAVGATTYLVPVVDTTTRCAAVLLELARDPAEARSCATAPGLTPVDTVCDYTLRLYTEPDHWVTKTAASADDARTCAASTECSGEFGTCTLDQVTQGACVSLSPVAGAAIAGGRSPGDGALGATATTGP